MQLPQPRTSEIVHVRRELEPVGVVVQRLEVLVVAADEVQRPLHPPLPVRVLRELGRHGALGRLAPVVVRATERLHVPHRQHQIHGTTARRFQGIHPRLHAVEATMDVSHADHELGIWRHRPTFKLPRADPHVEREFPFVCRNSEKRKKRWGRPHWDVPGSFGLSPEPQQPSG